MSFVTDHAFLINSIPLADMAENKTDWRGLTQYCNALYGGDPLDKAYALREVGSLFNHLLITPKNATDCAFDDEPDGAIRLMGPDRQWELIGYLAPEVYEAIEINETSLSPSWRDVVRSQSNVSASWKDHIWGQTKVSGVWKTFWTHVDGSCYALYGGALGGGWTEVSSSWHGYWLRLAASGSGTGGANSHSHGSVNATFDTHNATTKYTGGSGDRSGKSHGGHGAVSHVCNAASMYPNRVEYRMFQATTDFAFTMPQNGICFWISTVASIPSGWANTTAEDGYHIRIMTTGTANNVGAVNNSHTQSNVYSGNASSLEVRHRIGSGTLYDTFNTSHSHHTNSHTHANSGNQYYFRAVLMYATSEQPQFPINAAVLCNGSISVPGETWADVGYGGRLLQPYSSFGGYGGGATHQHTHFMNSSTTNLANADVRAGSSATNPLSSGGHVHRMQGTHPANSTNLPVYKDIQFYKRTA
jgi:hypothetical protein